MPGGEHDLFQCVWALGMNPSKPVVASGPVLATARGWLAAVLPFLENRWLQKRGWGARSAERVEELVQLPEALGMNLPLPVVAAGLVGTAVRGCSAMPSK